ncbi:hypothetical protein C0Q70_00869 [Pomacea canaliculata]|uniref:GRF-type domain-containing protein n=1 Tax=Pomacea canaliculata TaxID=400727 RepID=A0A2T7PXX9_POMCA|nr:hypothetical protein C0Q70_00869 [Pomacea canaliculata]
MDFHLLICFSVEFPAVLLNTKTGEIESEFHYYIQPQEHPTLSDFCKQLTGITQDQIDNGIPISLCLRKFYRWLEQQQQEKGFYLFGSLYNTSAKGLNVAAFVTWSDWDFGVCLHYELRRKQISKAPILNHWIDLRATYVKFYGRKPKGLNGALQDVGIKFEGREHSGLHDSRNTAKLVWKMIRDSCVLKITKSLSSESVTTSLHPGPQTTKTKINSHTSLTDPQKFYDNLKENLSSMTLLTSVTCCQDQEDNSTAVSCPVNHQNLGFKNHMQTKKGLSLRNMNAAGSNQTSSWISSKMQMAGNCKNYLISNKRKLESPEKTCCDSLVESLNCKISKIEKVTVAPSIEPATGPLKKCDSASVSETSILNSVTPISLQQEMIDKSPYSGACSVASISKKPNNSLDRNMMFSTTETPLSRRCDNLKPFHLCDWSSSAAKSEQNTERQRPTHKVHRKSVQITLPMLQRPVIKWPQEVVQPTPLQRLQASSSWLKYTPPLCHCGRRAKRRVVQNPGPNVGRWFFSCGKGTPSNCKKPGCSFFQWKPSENS